MNAQPGHVQTSARLGRLPTYAVGELALAKRRLVAQGVELIDLSAGDADFPPPAVAVEALARAAREPAMSRYAFQVGLPAFREAVARYMERRFGVRVDPFTEVLPIVGSKEALAHLALAVANPGDACILPDPGYPAYIGGTILSDAEPVYAPLRAANEFLVDLDGLPAERLARARLLYLNYPNNPTAAIASRAYLARVVAFCRARGIVLAYDNPYVEVTFDGYRAPSILEIDGAREVALEFHSLSKSFSMTGWRLGWAVGSAELIAALARLKGYVDTGQFLAIQAAGAAVLDDAAALVTPLAAALAARRDAAVEALEGAGLAARRPRATMYLWVPLPNGLGDIEFARALLEQEGVMLLPGTAFGAAGAGYVRVALTADRDRLREAARRVGRTLERLALPR